MLTRLLLVSLFLCLEYDVVLAGGGWIGNTRVEEFPTALGVFRVYTALGHYCADTTHTEHEGKWFYQLIKTPSGAVIQGFPLYDAQFGLSEFSEDGIMVGISDAGGVIYFITNRRIFVFDSRQGLKAYQQLPLTADSLFKTRGGDIYTLLSLDEDRGYIFAGLLYYESEWVISKYTGPKREFADSLVVENGRAAIRHYPEFRAGEVYWTLYNFKTKKFSPFKTGEVSKWERTGF